MKKIILFFITYLLFLFPINAQENNITSLKPNVGSLVPRFNSEIYNYNVFLNQEEKDISFNGICSDKTKINETYNLNEGYNDIYLMCEGGNTYKINVVRGKEKRKAGLKELSIKNHNIDFNVDKYEYFITLNTKEDSLDISFITYNDKDKVVVEGNNNLKKGNNIIFIKVLGKEEVIYKINVEKTKGVFGEVKSTKEEKAGVFKEVISIILLIIVCFFIIFITYYLLFVRKKTSFNV